MKSIFGTHTYNAMKAFQEFNAGADCPQGNETCRELNLLLQSMMKEYAPRPVDSSQISIAEMNTPERLKPAHDQNDQPLPTNQGQGADGPPVDGQQGAEGQQDAALGGPPVDQAPAEGQPPSQAPAAGQPPSQAPAAGQPPSQAPAAGQPPSQAPAEGQQPSQALPQAQAAEPSQPQESGPQGGQQATGGYLYNEPIGSVPGTLHRQY